MVFGTTELTASIIIAGAVMVGILLGFARVKAMQNFQKHGAAYPPGPSWGFVKFFGALALVALAGMFSCWKTIDLKDGQVTVETRTWWGLRSRVVELSAEEITAVETETIHRRYKGTRFPVDCLKIVHSGGRVLLPVDWGSAEPSVKALSQALADGCEGRFHERTFLLLSRLLPYFAGFSLFVLIELICSSRSGRKRDDCLSCPTKPVSLADVVIGR